MQNVKPAVMLFSVALACGLLLGSVNAFTLPKAREQEQIALNKNLNEILYPEEAVFDAIPVLLGDDSIINVYTALINSEITAYVIQSMANGYGGQVEVLTGINLNGEIIKVKIGSHSETPGLGANAEKEAFTGQYTAKSGHLNVVKQSPGENDIQAITSATITTNAVTTAVNSALDYFNKHVAGGVN